MEWERCSASCGGGWRRGWRDVALHPQFGGEDCRGSMMRWEVCSLADCAQMALFGVSKMVKTNNAEHNFHSEQWWAQAQGETTGMTHSVPIQVPGGGLLLQLAGTEAQEDVPPQPGQRRQFAPLPKGKKDQPSSRSGSAGVFP